VASAAIVRLVVIKCYQGASEAKQKDAFEAKIEVLVRKDFNVKTAQ